VISSGHKCEKPLRIMLQHVTYIPIPRFLVTVCMDYYIYYQFRRNPWSSISMDFITDLPSSKAFNSIFVVVDRLTKMAYFMPCNKTVTSVETARLFMNNI
jgi:hypothetical protein